MSNTPFDPSVGGIADEGGVYLGDQIGVVTANNTAYSVWTDTRNGNQQIFFNSLDIAQAPQPPADRFSPNNSPGTATELGPVTVQQVLPGLALLPGTSDEYFHLEAGATGKLVVTLAPAVPSANLQVGLLNANGMPPPAPSLQVELLDASGNPLPPSEQPVVTTVLDQTGAVVSLQLVIPVTSGTAFFIHIQGNSSTGISYTLSAEALTDDFGTVIEGQTPQPKASIARWPIVRRTSTVS